MDCLNCGEEVSGNYCAACGQRRNVQQITLKSLSGRFLESVTNINRGFLHNLKALTLRPKETVIGYLEGRRVSVYPPLQYAIVGVTLLTLIDWQFGSKLEISTSETVKSIELYNFGYSYGKFISENIKFLWLFNILFFSIPSYLFFKRYNFAEHLTINAFVIGHSALIAVLLWPVSDIRLIFNPVLLVAVIVLYALIFWQPERKAETIVISLLTFAVGFVLFFLVPIPFHWLLMQLGI